MLKKSIFTLVSLNRKIAITTFDIQRIEELKDGKTNIIFNAYNEATNKWNIDGITVFGTFDQVLTIVNLDFQILVEAGTGKRKAFDTFYVRKVEQKSPKVTTIWYQITVGLGTEQTSMDVDGSFDKVMKQLEEKR
jgi:hypothetical protein